jgi:DNA-binding CsgD family transcriptional regulator
MHAPVPRKNKRLAQRRSEIIELVQRGFSRKESATVLNLREQTVRVYRSRLKIDEANAKTIRHAGVSVSVDPATAGMLTEEAERRGILCGQLVAELWLGRHDRGRVQLSDRLLAALSTEAERRGQSADQLAGALLAASRRISRL